MNWLMQHSETVQEFITKILAMERCRAPPL
jgi:hypothetical protein